MTGEECDRCACSSDSARVQRTALLACTAAHDLANALMVVSAHCAKLREQPLPGPARSHVDLIDEAAARAAGLLRRLLRPAEASAAPTVVELDAALRGFEASLRDAAAPAALELGLGAAGARVRLDPVELQRALLNLAQNGGAAAGAGGRVRVRSRLEPLAAVVTVEDDGPGLAPEVAARTFQPFCTGRPDGVGLGLLAARLIAEAAGGELRHASGERGGAVFELRLPLA